MDDRQRISDQIGGVAPDLFFFPLNEQRSSIATAPTTIASYNDFVPPPHVACARGAARFWASRRTRVRALFAPRIRHCQGIAPFGLRPTCPRRIYYLTGWVQWRGLYIYMYIYTTHARTHAHVCTCIYAHKLTLFSSCPLRYVYNSALCLSAFVRCSGWVDICQDGSCRVERSQRSVIWWYLLLEYSDWRDFLVSITRHTTPHTCMYWTIDWCFAQTKQKKAWCPNFKNCLIDFSVYAQDNIDLT